jgi:hypothetical protein
MKTTAGQIHRDRTGPRCLLQRRKVRQRGRAVRTGEVEDAQAGGDLVLGAEQGGADQQQHQETHRGGAG